MNPDLYIVRKINSLAGRKRSVDLFLDLLTRYGHWAFVIYGLLLWLAPGEGRMRRRRCCVLAFLGVVVASMISFVIGKLWFRDRPFTKDWRIWNFTGHKANASFPSNHTMNGAVVAMELLKMGMPGSHLMAFFAGVLACTRLLAGMHYPTDLLGGVTIAGCVHTLLHRGKLEGIISFLTKLASKVSDLIFKPSNQ